MLVRASVAPAFTRKWREPCALNAILPLPSIVVFAAIDFCELSVIECRLGPQLNVTAPPPARAALNAASVQLAGVPVPTTPAACAGVACIPTTDIVAHNTAAAKRVLNELRLIALLLLLTI